jgi:hypothetical protein
MDRVITTFYKVSVNSGSLGTAGDLRFEPELSLWDSRVSIKTSLATPWLMMLSGKAKASGVRAHSSGRWVRGFYVYPDLYFVGEGGEDVGWSVSFS